MTLRENEERENKTPREDPDDPGHIWRSPKEHFNQRTLFLAERFDLNQQDIKDAYKDKRDGYKEIRDLFLAAQDARTLKNFFVPLLLLVGGAVSLMSTGPCVTDAYGGEASGIVCTTMAVGWAVMGGSLYGAYHNNRKHEGVGETLRGEIEKMKSGAPESPPAP